MESSTSTSSLISPSTSLSSSSSTSAAAIPTLSTATTTTPAIPTAITTSDLSSTATIVTTATTTDLTDTTTSSSIITDTTLSTPTISTTFVTSPTLTTPTTTSLSTSTPVTIGGPAVVTATSVHVTTISTSQTPNRTAAPSSSNEFFENKGAVAGVFTVVGLVIAALLIILVVTIIRRRRAKKFDREIEAAAAEAAAAPAPHFLDDDDDDDPYRRPADQPTAYNPQYSDISSHGTYSQPPLGSQEMYGMRDLGTSPGELYNNNPYASGGAAGAAGVGVARARSTRDPGAFASGFQDGATPYPAFAGPAAFHSGAYGNEGGHDSLGTGVGAGVGAGMQRGMSLSHHTSADHTINDQEQQYSQSLHPGQYVQQSGLARNPSQVTYNTTHASSTLVGSPVSPPKEQSPYAAHYASAPVEEADESAYGGYADDTQGAGHKREDRQSYNDDDEDDRRPKILKVANE